MDRSRPLSARSSCNGRTYTLLALVLLAALGVDGRAQLAPARSDAIVRTVDRDELIGEVQSLTSESLTIRSDDGPVSLPRADLIRMTMGNSLSERIRGDALVLLAGGDWLVGKIESGDDTGFDLDTRDLGRVRLPLEAVRAVRFQIGEVLRERFDPAGEAGAVRDRRDRVSLMNGDVLKGFLVSIGGDRVVIDTDLGESPVPRRVVRRVDLASDAAPVGTVDTRVTLVNSGRLAVAGLSYDGSSSATARDRSGAPVTIPIDRVGVVDFLGGRWRPLTSVLPVSAEHTPMLSLDWTWRTNRNVLGGALVVDGERFDYGLGVHSRASLIYELTDDVSTFVTSFGIDDDSGSFASVDVRILVDDQIRFEQADVRPGKLYGPVRVPVRGARRIELVVDFGEAGDLQDRFDWIDPGFVR